MGLERNHSVKIGMETVYGDGGATPTAIPLFYTDSRPAPDFAKHDNPVYSGSLGRAKVFMGKRSMSMPVKFYLKGSGTAGTPSELGKLLRIFGLSETIVASTSVTYSPRNTGMESAALTVNLDGVQYVIVGARGESLKIPMVAGEPVICEGTIKGIYADPTAVGFSAPTFTDEAVTPPIVESMALTLGGNNHVIRKCELELKSVLGLRDSINAVTGLASIDIIGREFGGTMLLEVDGNNDVELWTALRSATEMAIASTGFGATGNKFSISTSNFQVDDIKNVVDQGVTCYEVPFRINKNATLASELSLKWL